MKIKWKLKELTQEQLDAMEAKRRSAEKFVVGDKISVCRESIKYVPKADRVQHRNLFDNGALGDGEELFVKELWSTQLGLGSATGKVRIWVHKRLCEKVVDGKGTKATTTRTGRTVKSKA